MAVNSVGKNSGSGFLQRAYRRLVDRQAEVPQQKQAKLESGESNPQAAFQALLDKLAALVDRLSGVVGAGGGTSGAGGVGGAPGVSGMPNLNPASLAPPAGGNSPVFTGFDAQKLAADLVLGPDGRPKSAKYTFARLAQQAANLNPPAKMPMSKQEAEEWFIKYIKPGMEAAGFGVDWVKGDKAFVRTRENPGGEVIDFVRGAGSSDPSYIALAWQSEGPASVSGGSFYTGPLMPVTRDEVLKILQKYPPTNEGIKQAEAELKAKFGQQVKILDHPLRLDKIDFGNGFVVDVIMGAGGSNPSWGWLPEHVA